MKLYYHTTHTEGEVIGPVTLDEIMKDVASGFLPKETMICEDGSTTGNWISFAELRRKELDARNLSRSHSGKEYKVLSQRDDWFSGRFDPPSLEKALNAHAKLGWSVLTITTASREGFMTGPGKDEIIVVFERSAGNV